MKKTALLFAFCLAMLAPKIYANGPDLVIIPEKTTMDISTTDWDYTVNLKVHTKNIGTAAIYTGFRMGFYLVKGNTVSTKDLFLNYGNYSDLGVGSESTMTISINLAYEGFNLNENGTYHIGVIIDDKNDVKESNEDNNTYVIEKEINYVVPSARAKRIAYDKAQAQAKEAVNQMAGKIMFKTGAVDINNMGGNTFSSDFSFKQFTDAQALNGEDFSFVVFYKQPLKDLFAGYIAKGMDATAWSTNVNYINLVYKVYVDGKLSAISDNEPDNISFFSPYYSYVLMGQYAQAQTLMLQYVLLSELYKLPAGDHNVKVEAYAKTTVTGKNDVAPEAVADGSFNIHVDAQEKIAYFKKRGGELYPPAEKRDANVEASAKNLAVSFFQGLDSKFTLASIKYTAIMNSDWNYVKNYKGVILSRYIFITMYIKLSDGSCKMAGFNIEQESTGSGTYSKLHMAQGVTYNKNLTPMPCEAIK